MVGGRSRGPGPSSSNLNGGPSLLGPGLSGSSANANANANAAPLSSPNPPLTRTYLTPVLVGLLPMVFSFIFGGGEVLAEICLTLVCIYFLYQIIKVPWDLYLQYRVIRLEAAGDVDVMDTDREVMKHLKHRERLWLLLVCLAPLTGGIGLHLYRICFPQYARILTDFNLVLFVLSAMISPLQHLFGLARQDIRTIQRRMTYPHHEVSQLKNRIGALERRLDSLRTRVVSQQELSDVQEVIKPILAQLLRSIKNVEERNGDLERMAHERLTAVEVSLGLSSAPPQSISVAFVQWAMARISRDAFRLILSPILVPVQMAATTWNVLARPFIPEAPSGEDLVGGGGGGDSVRKNGGSASEDPDDYAD